MISTQGRFTVGWLARVRFGADYGCRSRAILNSFFAEFSAGDLSLADL